VRVCSPPLLSPLTPADGVQVAVHALQGPQELQDPSIGAGETIKAKKMAVNLTEHQDVQGGRRNGRSEGVFGGSLSSN